jgi:DNA-binding MltR family transcriptional regulator
MLESESFEEVNPLFKEFVRALEVWNNEESGRGVVLIAAAMLDEVLEKSIRAFLVENDGVDGLLKGSNAPIGTLSARINLAYSLGLLSRAEYEECHRLRKIRNQFAHDIHVSFSNQQVIDLCANLNLYVKQNDETRKHPREKFEIGALGIILCLTNRQQYIAGRRLKYSDWGQTVHK